MSLRDRVETALTGLEYPWSLNFAPDGALYVTERPGKMIRVDLTANKVTPIGGVPEPRVQGDMRQLAHVLRNPFRYAAEKGRHMWAHPRAIPAKALDYAKYDMVRALNQVLDAGE